jgi:hypothetical protein
VTLYDDNNVQIAATTLIDTQSGLALCMKCTNNNKFAIGLWSSQTAVNGFTVVGSLLQNVEAGETVTMQLVMDNDELSGIGIKQIAQMSLTLYIDNLEENTQLAYTPILSFSLPGVSAPRSFRTGGYGPRRSGRRAGLLARLPSGGRRPVHLPADRK